MSQDLTHIPKRESLLVYADEVCHHKPMTRHEGGPLTYIACRDVGMFWHHYLLERIMGVVRI